MTPLKLIQQAIHTLDEEDRRTLASLYGLDGAARHSREELSEGCGLSLGIVDQMETQAIRRLRHPRTRKLLMKALQEGEQEIWDALSQSSALVLKKDIPSKVSERMPGEYQIAIKCLLNGVDQWLSDHSCETPKAWYRGRYPCEDLVRLVEKVDGIHHELILPTSLQFLAEIVDVEMELLLLAVTLANFSSIYRGYFANSSMGIRHARAIHLHQMLSLDQPNQRITMPRLLMLYKEKYPDDPLGFEELDVVLNRHPHLFLPVGYLHWCAIGAIQEDLSHIHYGAPPTPPEQDGRILRHLIGRDKDVDKRPDPLDVLHEILALKGPSLIRDIVVAFDGRVEDTNKHQTLKTALEQSCQVVALAPEFYGLKEQQDLALKSSNIWQLLMTTRQCRIYALARRAGEPMDAWPLWDHGLERQWCYWAEHNAQSKLFRSLLAVAEPQLWEEHQAVRNLWSFKKQLLGRFCVDMDLKPSAWEKAPSVIDVLSAAIYAKQLGYTNWLRLQDITGQQLFVRLHEQDTAPLLAILIGLGLVAPATHWQAAHFVTPEMDATIFKLSRNLHKTGSIRWDDALGQELIGRLEAACASDRLGWVAPKALAGLACTLGRRDAEPTPLVTPVAYERPTTTDEARPLRQLRLPLRKHRG